MSTEHTLMSTEVLGRRGGDSFRNALALTMSRWWVIAVCGLGGGVIALAGCLVQTPVYEATSTLYVTSASDANAQSAYQGSLASQQRVTSYTKLVDSDAVMHDAIARSGVPLSLDEASRKVSASSTPDTVLLSVHVRDSDPQVAVSLANGVGSSLSEYVKSLERPSDGGVALAKLTVVSPATLADGPVSPATKRYVALGVGLGLLLGCVLLYVYDRIDVKVRSAAEVTEIAGAPVLSEVPEDEGLVGGAVDFSRGSSISAEAFRRLRSNLGFISVDDPLRSVLVTSPAAAEGKTTVALNLAAAMAEAGRRVILVDADLRRPTVARRLGLSSEFGLSELMRGGVELSDLVQPSGIAGLDVLASGQLPPSASELLGSQNAARAFERLKSDYEFVVVDAPPMLPVTDAIVTSQRVDAVLLVVRYARTKSNDLVSAVDELGTAKAPICGVVVNGRVSRGRDYSKYAYYGSSVRGDAMDRTSPTYVSSVNQ